MLVSPFSPPSRANVQKLIRAADAKEVGVGDPAEETFCYPNKESLKPKSVLSSF